MQRQAPSFGRVFVMVFFALSVFGLLLFLWLSFGGSVPLKAKGYRVRIAFPEAAQLVSEADVRIAGVNVGKVKGTTLDQSANREIATVQLDPKYAPLRSDARAILRQKTLLGETYIGLTTGSPKAPAIPDGGRLANGRVAQEIQFDEVLQAFDPRTRQAFRDWQAELVQAGKGRGQDLSDAFGSLPRFTGDATPLLGILNQEGGSVRRLVRNTGVTFRALTRDDHQLAHLITNSETTFRATASQNQALAQTFQILPTFLDESKATLARLRTFALDTDPLVKLLRPDLREVGPTLASVRRLSPDLRQFFLDLPPLERASVKGLPALSQTVRGLRPVLGALSPFLSQLNPILDYLGVYNLQVAEFLQTGEAGLAGTDKTTTRGAPGGQSHILPQIVLNGPQSVAFAKNRSSDNRGNAYLPPTSTFPYTPKGGRFAIFPNFDCGPTNGQATPSNNPKRIGCFVAPPLKFQGGQLDSFTHVNPLHYKKGR